MKKIISNLLICIMALSLLVGCGSGGTTSGEPAEVEDLVLYTTIQSEMTTFNMLYSQAEAVSMVLVNCIDGLVTNDSYGNLIPNLAESWESDDGGKTWTFHLRDDATWVN